MKPTGLLIATGLLVVAGGTIWWFNKHPQKETPATPASPAILSLKEDQIEGIRIAKTGSEPIVLKKLAGKWVIAEPKQLDADQDAVKALVTSLAPMTSDRLIDDRPASVDSFGLASPVVEVDVTLKGGAVNKVLFGGDTPSGSDTYVKVADKPAVYTVLTSAKTGFDKSVSDLRDKRLLPFNSDKITAVTVQAKGAPFTFGKNAQGEWQITKPSPMRADTSAVDDLVRKLKDAKMDTTAADDKKSASEFASGANIGTVTVTDNSGPFALTLHQAKDKSYYAKTSAIEGAVFKLSGDLGDGIKDKDADSFRNRKLFDFGFNDPTRVEIDGAVYQKSGDKWTGPSGQIDAPSIQAVIDKLRDLSASKFTDRMVGTQSLVAGVTSGDNHKFEKVVIHKAGEEYQAQRDGEPSVYVIESKNYDDLRKAISDIKPYKAPPPAKK
ncbi:MAG: DUF4340 domain-containing protein [Acidobacteriota bacterium]|nr:DUF4340 domain-containing protein [Acidobacteriota bacterium]